MILIIVVFMRDILEGVLWCLERPDEIKMFFMWIQSISQENASRGFGDKLYFHIKHRLHS